MLQRKAQCKYYTVINHLGQVVLPAAVLAQLGIDSTSDLAMYIEDNAIVLRRVGSAARCRPAPPRRTVSGKQPTQERLTTCRTKSSSAARGCTT